MQQALLEAIVQDEAALTLNQNSTYLRSYPEFLRYFRDIPQIEEHHLIIAANFTYSWMPTILRFKRDTFQDAVAILNRAKMGELLSDEDLWCLIHLVNNSIVGVSKLLHFGNPEMYAIWDSRVARYLSRFHFGSEGYLAYLALCRSVVQDPAFVSVHNSVIKKVGYPISGLRAIELVMYETEVRRGANEGVTE